MRPRGGLSNFGGVICRNFSGASHDWSLYKYASAPTLGLCSRGAKVSAAAPMMSAAASYNYSVEPFEICLRRAHPSEGAVLKTWPYESLVDNGSSFSVQIFASASEKTKPLLRADG